MKILITSDWYTPAINGVVASVKSLEHGLRQAGHDVRVLTLSQTPHSYREGNVTYIGAVSAKIIYPGARFRSALARAQLADIYKWKPDIVHSQCEFSTFIPARKLAKSLNIPLIHTYHTVYEDYTHYFSPSRKLGHMTVAEFSRFIIKRTNSVIVPTEKVRKLLETYKISRPVNVIPTGICLERFKAPVSEERILSLKQSLNIPIKNQVLVYLGRLAEEKNVDELIKNMHVLRELPVSLLIVGDGPHRSHLEALTASLKLSDRVVFTGMLPPDKVTEYYKLGDLFVSASTSETQGLTYIEALATGLPALCRKDSCLDGVIINDLNGWQYTDDTDYLNRVRSFVSSSNHKQLSDSSLKIADSYSSETFAARVEEIYKEQLMLTNSLF